MTADRVSDLQEVVQASSMSYAQHHQVDCFTFVWRMAANVGILSDGDSINGESDGCRPMISDMHAVILAGRILHHSIEREADVATAKQRSAAKRNIKKAGRPAKRKQTLKRGSKKTRTATTKRGAKTRKGNAARSRKK